MTLNPKDYALNCVPGSHCRRNILPPRPLEKDSREPHPVQGFRVKKGLWGLSLGFRGLVFRVDGLGLRVEG